MKIGTTCKLSFTILVVLFVSVSSFAKTNVYFSPSKGCETNIVDLINKSNHTINIAVYSINNTNIIKAIKNAYDRGVKIRILTDKVQAGSKYSRVVDLYNYGVNIRVHSKFKIEHNKFAIFDSRQIVSGSYNWTNSATYKNSENCVFLVNKRIVNKYGRRFNYLWKSNTKIESDRWFEQMIRL